ncbi:MAG: hypothetical protein IPK97_07060 [Ahniella sp.]|nr:hypothetical protein [Ahniella sp.]
MSEVFLRPASLIHPGPSPAGSQGPFVRVAMLGALVALAACAPTPPLDPLPKLSIDPERVTVSGISSGAYMATQVHVALSSQIHGVATVAGGPYGCASGKLDVALSSCMKADPPIDVAALTASVKAKADAGQVDPLNELADDPVLILHGANDAIVSPKVSQANVDAYAAMAPEARVEHQSDLPIGHVWPTAAAGDCSNSGNHVADCGIDLAQRILQFLAPVATALQHIQNPARCCGSTRISNPIRPARRSWAKSVISMYRMCAANKPAACMWCFTVAR